MREQITFFDFFESFVPPRELRLLLHDAVVTGGALDVKQRPPGSASRRRPRRRWSSC